MIVDISIHKNGNKCYHQSNSRFVRHPRCPNALVLLLCDILQKFLELSCRCVPATLDALDVLAYLLVTQLAAIDVDYFSELLLKMSQVFLFPLKVTFN
jgi:hypothetical protein